MHFPLASPVLLFGTALAAFTQDFNNGDALAQFKILASKAQASQAAILDANAKRAPPPPPHPPAGQLPGPPGSSQRCTKEKLTVRKPCLVPGVRTRYDDFLASHINQTLTIHYTGTFMAWHRWFTFQFEQALKNECGYKGSQPYWNWALYSDDPLSSPIFDGSDFSMSGDGEAVANKGPITLLLGNFAPVVLPPGNGGGCVKTGPFKDMVVNLGPVSLPLNNGSVVTGTGLEYNPRCLKRDLSAGVNQAFANATSIMQLLGNNDNVADFQLVMQGIPGSGSIGVHGGGHYTIGGDPAGDTFTSPGDPVFYLHHGMIDLVWWVWQMMDFPGRRNQVAGTNTFLNQPPSDNTTLDTVIDLMYAGGGPITMRELTSITDGPFCYTYSL
ncbi:uncharacterized protein PG998_005651 [Apiospora kogelbergensis]|uniref:uncharacterized protein n=1 Tax=Apiospora kogelbergensis TaxID=1337665 RepID=UPI00312E0198